MLACHNNHPMQATIKIDATATTGAPLLHFGEVEVYCEEDCSDIPDAITKAAYSYFHCGQRDAWEYPAGAQRDSLAIVRLGSDTPVSNAPCEHEEGTDVCPEHGPHNEDYCPACSLRHAANTAADAIDIADDAALTPAELREIAHELRVAVQIALGAA
jgi:hypothetical protein